MSSVNLIALGHLLSRVKFEQISLRDEIVIVLVEKLENNYMGELRIEGNLQL